MATQVTVVLWFNDEDVYAEEELRQHLEDDLCCVVTEYVEEDI